MKKTLILTSFLFLTLSCSGDDDEPTATPQVVYTQDECRAWLYEWQKDKYTSNRVFGLFSITELKWLSPVPPPVPADKIYTGRIENGIESYYIVKCSKK